MFLRFLLLLGGGLVAVLAAVVFPALLAVANPPQRPVRHSPLTPEDAVAAFRVAPGLRVDLVATEPDIQSPVAMAFDEDGRLWVVEMRDYPNGPAKGQPPEGRV